MSDTSSGRVRARLTAEENGFGGQAGTRKPYNTRPGAGAYHRCVVPVAMTRHGEPPITCGGLVFGRDMVQHLVDMHNVPPGPMSPADLDLAYVLVKVEAEENTRGYRALLCDCGAKRLEGKRACASCHSRESAGSAPPLVPHGTSNAEALRLYRARARANGKCGICRARDAEPDHLCCGVCQANRRGRARVRAGR